MTLKELYDDGTDILDESGIDSPETDAFYLLEHVTGIGRSEYLLNKEKEVSRQIEEQFMKLIRIRAGHVPYQYITGEAPFMGFMIKVTGDVLIPRFDTEVLCEEALKLMGDGSRVLDMCTGSGCIAVALKCLCSESVLTACDISEKALNVAMENARTNGADVEFVKGDLFEPLEGRVFDLIVSNPPYVTEQEYACLSPEVKDHEPALALLAGGDGLDVYKRFVPEAYDHLINGGTLIMEMGCYQGSALRSLMERSGFRDIKIIKDLAGLDRVIIGKRD